MMKKERLAEIEAALPPTQDNPVHSYDSSDFAIWELVQEVKRLRERSHCTSTEPCLARQAMGSHIGEMKTGVRQIAASLNAGAPPAVAVARLTELAASRPSLD